MFFMNVAMPEKVMPLAFNKVQTGMQPKYLRSVFLCVYIEVP